MFVSISFDWSSVLINADCRLSADKHHNLTSKLVTTTGMRPTTLLRSLFPAAHAAVPSNLVCNSLIRWALSFTLLSTALIQGNTIEGFGPMEFLSTIGYPNIGFTQHSQNPRSSQSILVLGWGTKVLSNIERLPAPFLVRAAM